MVVAGTFSYIIGGGGVGWEVDSIRTSLVVAVVVRKWSNGCQDKY